MLSGPHRDITLKPCHYTPLPDPARAAPQSSFSAVRKMYREAVPFGVKALLPGDSKVLCGLPVYHWGHGGHFQVNTRRIMI